MLNKYKVLNDLQELESNMNTIEACYFYILSSTKNQFNRQEFYDKGYAEFESFKQRMQDLRVEVKNMNMKE